MRLSERVLVLGISCLIGLLPTAVTVLVTHELLSTPSLAPGLAHTQPLSLTLLALCLALAGAHPFRPAAWAFSHPPLRAASGLLYIYFLGLALAMSALLLHAHLNLFPLAGIGALLYTVSRRRKAPQQPLDPAGPEEKVPSLPFRGDGAELMGLDGNAFPLQSLQAEATICGPLSSVVVRQRFLNSRTRPVEAIYVFPLPGTAAVYEFQLRVGKRALQGRVLEKQEARQVYEVALAGGHRAGLLEQHRDNVFRVSVGNLPPGEEITVELSYATRLECFDSETEFRFPVLVAERFAAGAPDAAQITAPRCSQDLFGFHLKVHIETGGLPIRKLNTGQHATHQTHEEQRLTLELAKSHESPDRDFVLRFALREDRAPGLLFQYEQNYLLQLFPPSDLRPREVGRDVVFLVDRSGSMQEQNMGVARQAVTMFLDSLSGADCFALAAFDNKLELFEEGRLHEHYERGKAMEWMKSIHGRGGTFMHQPLRWALGLPRSPDRPGVIVLITDGQISNEEHLYREVQANLAGWRIHTLGIDRNVNDAFLRRLAALGAGTCELIIPGDNLVDPLGRLVAELGSPVVSKVTLHANGLLAGTTNPEVIPDLYSRRPLVITGKKKGNKPLQIRGQGERPFELTLPVIPSQNPALAKIWARDRITTLEDALRLSPDGGTLRTQLLALSLEANLLSSVTSFVVVDAQSGVSQKAVRVVQPIKPTMPRPQGQMCSSVAVGAQLSERQGKMPQSVVQLMQIDPLTIEVGRELLILLDPTQGEPLLKGAEQVRKEFLADVGFLLPGVRLRDNLSLNPKEYVLKLKEIEVARGKLDLDRLMVLAAPDDLQTLVGEGFLEPTARIPALWVDRGEADRASARGWPTISSVNVLLSHWGHVLRSRAAELLGRQETQAWLNELRQRNPVAVRMLVPDLLSMGELQKVLQLLLAERLSLSRGMDILETLVLAAARTRQPAELAAAVRREVHGELQAEAC